MIDLHYIGNGAALPDVPARDLTAAETAGDLSHDADVVYDRAALLASGLYEAA